MSNQITMGTRLRLDEIDYKVFTNTPGESKEEALSTYLTEELFKAGGKAIVAVDNTGVAVEWAVPEITLEQFDAQQVAFVAHLIQIGLLVDPVPMIANAAYSGGILNLSLLLLNMNSFGKNTYLATRDARLLASVAPKSLQAWSMLGLIELENGNIECASMAFAEAQKIDPLDFLSCKYMAVSLSVSLPSNAVVFAERALAILAAKGIPLDKHMRATYGMSLLASKLKKESEIQFLLACGHKKPSMSPTEWVNGGYRITDAEIPLALAPKLKKKKA